MAGHLNQLSRLMREQVVGLQINGAITGLIQIFFRDV